MKNTETITLQIKKSRRASFLQLLRKFDFVKIETPADMIKRYLKNTPASVPLTEDIIIDEMMQERWKKNNQ